MSKLKYPASDREGKTMNNMNNATEKAFGNRKQKKSTTI